ncbi:TPA: hypothetical protein ACXDAZ_002552 [Clostridium botulinum]
MDKLEKIQDVMPEDGEVLVRTYGKNKWFVHFMIVISETENKSIYKTYTDNLDYELDKIIAIINYCK